MLQAQGGEMRDLALVLIESVAEEIALPVDREPRSDLGGARAVAIGYLATAFGWTSPFIVAFVLCLLSALLAGRIDPCRSITERLHAGD